jgi:hypothetical protein
MREPKNYEKSEEELTPEEEAEEFDDTDDADKEAMEKEKADPDDKRNEP